MSSHCRVMHRINCPLHRAWYSARDNIHWDTSCVLLGSKCFDIQTICCPEQPPSSPHPPAPFLPFSHLPRVLFIVEARAPMVEPTCTWRCLDHGNSHLSPYGALQSATIGVVGAIDAMACCYIDFSQRLSHDNLEALVIQEVWYLGIFDSFVLPSVWCSLNLQSWRNGKGGWEWCECQPCSFTGYKSRHPTTLMKARHLLFHVL